MIVAGLTGVLSCARMFHIDADISLFVALIDLPVRLDHVLQRIAAITPWLQLARLNQRLEENACCSTRGLLSRR